jgi:hypothetical protein
VKVSRRTSTAHWLEMRETTQLISALSCLLPPLLLPTILPLIHALIRMPGDKLHREGDDEPQPAANGAASRHRIMQEIVAPGEKKSNNPPPPPPQSWGNALLLCKLTICISLGFVAVSDAPCFPASAAAKIGILYASLSLLLRFPPSCTFCTGCVASAVDE